MRTDHARRRLEKLIDEEVDESFPASDPPSWSGMHIGTPCPDDKQSDCDDCPSPDPDHAP
jgi:hypothetical protein